MKHLRTPLFLIVTSCLVSPSAHAEVKSSAENHMSITIDVSVKADADAAWKDLLNVAKWWSPAHTWSGDSKNLSLSASPGGGFDEKLNGEGFVRHMQVIYSDPGNKLRMTGVLGPMQEHALQGTMTVTLTKKGDTTVISTTYHVSGHFPGGLDQLAPIVDQVLTEQFQRLAKTIEGVSLDESGK